MFSDKAFNTGRLAKHADDTRAVCDGVGVCDMAPYGSWDIMRNISLLARFYSEVTGFTVTPQEFKRRGDRIWNMERLLNVREGFTRQDDAFPWLWVKNIEIPIKLRTRDFYLSDWLGNRLTKDDLERMLDDYYDEHGWDKETGIPTPEKLAELGLQEFTPV